MWNGNVRKHSRSRIKKNKKKAVFQGRFLFALFDENSACNYGTSVVQYTRNK